MLTPMREKFCQGLAEGLTQSEAYRRSTNTSHWKPETVWDTASKLAAKPEVIQRVEELKAAIVSKYVAKRAWDLNTIIDEYAINAYGAREDRQWAASNAAITGIGKAIGVLSDKIDINVTHSLKPGMSLEELEGRVRRLDALEAGVEAGMIEGVIEGEVRELTPPSPPPEGIELDT